jgi:hypothetical protein
MPKELGLEVLSDPNAVLDFAGAGTGRPFLAKDLNNFAPNVSFAWDPFNTGKTSLRGGFAISYAIDNNATVRGSAVKQRDFDAERYDYRRNPKLHGHTPNVRRFNQCSDTCFPGAAYVGGSTQFESNTHSLHHGV